jgi:hypothetical protein
VLYSVAAFAWIACVASRPTETQHRLQVLATLVFAVVVSGHQRRLTAAHFAAGGAKASWVRAWVVGAGAFIFLLAAWQIMDPDHLSHRQICPHTSVTGRLKRVPL